MLNLVAYLQPQSYCAHSLFLFPRAFAHCCLECTPKGPYRATDATVPHFLMPSQRPPQPAPLADTWRTMARTTAMARRHRTHCSACAGWTLSGKPGISFIERHDHLAKCSCPTWPSNQQLSPIRRASAQVGLARQSKRARSMFSTASRQLIVLSENNAHWNNAKTTHDACGGLPC